MAKRRRTVKKKKAEKSEKTLDKSTLERLECRFRRSDGDNWCKGKLVVGWKNKDGSLNVIDERTGNIRALPADTIQVTERGPRGGKVWIDYEEKVS